MAGSSAGEVSLSVKADTQGLGNRIREGVEDETGKTDFSHAGKIIGGAIAAGVGAVMVGIGAVVKVGIDETLDASAGIAQLNAGIQSTGNVANVSVKGMTDLASSIQNMSGQTDDSIVKAESLIQTFTNIRNVGADKIFDQATMAAADMAAKMGGDASSNAIILGKALNDPVNGISALTRVGVTFTDAQKQQIAAMQASGDTIGAQKVILGELNKEFGGAAQAAGQSLPGQLNILKRNFEDMSQTVVGGLMPAITPLFPILQDAIKQVTPVLSDLIKQIGPTLGDALKMVIPFIVDLMKYIGPILGDAIKQLMPVLGELLKTLGPVLGEILKAVGPLIGTLISALAQILPVVMPLVETIGQLLVPILQILSPILQILTPIITLIIQVALVPLQIIFKLVGDALSWLWGLIGPFVQSFADGFTKMMSGAKGPMDFIQQGIKAVGDVFDWLYKNIIKPTVDAIGVAFNWFQKNIVEPVAKAIQMSLKGLGDVFDWLYKNIIKPTFDAIGVAFDWIWNNVIKPVVDFINGAIQTIGDTVNSVFGGISDFISGVFSGIGDIIKGVINGFIDVMNGTVDLLNPIIDGPIGDAARGIGINVQHIPHIPHLAEGGVVMPKPGGVLAQIAEAGKPEVVIPLDKLDQVGGKGGGQTINYYAAPNNSIDAEQDLFAAMRRSKLLVGW